MTRLNKLTPEQERLIPEFRDQFLQIGLSTAPADFDVAEDALRDAYCVAGLDPPKIMIRLRSPREGAWAAAMLANSKLAPNVQAQVRVQVGAQVWAQVVRAIYGQHDANWLGLYAFFDGCGIRLALSVVVVVGWPLSPLLAPREPRP